MIPNEQSVQSSLPHLSTAPAPSGVFPQISAIPAASDWGGRDPYHKEVNAEELWLAGDIHSSSTVPTIRPVPPMRIDSSWAPHFEITQPTLTSPPARTFPANWIKIPQRSYSHGSKQLDFRESEPVFFYTRDHPGINLKDALHKDLAHLNGQDDPMVQVASGVISCRLLVSFPCYFFR